MRFSGAIPLWRFAMRFVMHSVVRFALSAVFAMIFFFYIMLPYDSVRSLPCVRPCVLLCNSAYHFTRCFECIVILLCNGATRFRLLFRHAILSRHFAILFTFPTSLLRSNSHSASLSPFPSFSPLSILLTCLPPPPFSSSPGSLTATPPGLVACTNTHIYSTGPFL